MAMSDQQGSGRDQEEEGRERDATGPSSGSPPARALRRSTKTAATVSATKTTVGTTK